MLAHPTVAFECAPLLGARTGVGVVTAGLLDGLLARGDVAVRGFGLTGTGWRALRATLPPQVGAGRVPLPAGPALRVWARLPVPPIEWVTGRVDVVHGTNFVVPPARRAGRLVTVHDLTPVRFPELATANSRRYPALVAAAVARGAWVHTFSHSVAEEVVEAFGADPERVRVVPAGVAPAPPAPPQRGRPYVLALGTVEPRKDLPGLVAAFDLLAAEHADLELRIAGPDGWGAAALTVAIAAARHRDRIVRLGWVDDPGALLSGAAVLAYPSLYEGFGLPPLEAMARGVPVVATTAGALPEVLGDAALLVPPRDAAALAAAIAQALADPGPLRAAGLRRAARSTWSAAAEGMVALYRDVG